MSFLTASTAHARFPDWFIADQSSYKGCKGVISISKLRNGGFEYIEVIMKMLTLTVMQHQRTMASFLKEISVSAVNKC